MRGAAALTLGTSVILTIGLSLSLAAVVFRLYSQVPQGIPPVLPGLILSLAMAAGSFLFLGLRLRQGRKVRPATYQMALSLVAVGVVVLVRQAARLFGAEWTASGSALLGMSGLVLCTSGTLVRRPARGALVQGEVPAGVAEGLHAEFDIIAKVDLLHVWTFLLWWVAVAVLLEMKAWVALLVTAVTFPAAHIFATFAEIFLYVVTWGEPSPFFDV